MTRLLVTLGLAVAAVLSSFGTAHATPILAPTAVTFTAFTPPTTGTVGVAYAGYTFAASGTAPISFTITSGALPSGLTLSSGGVLSGTPTSAGGYTFTVTATDSASPPASDSVAISITISPAPTVPTFTASSPPATGAVGIAYSGYTFAASGTAPITFSVASGALPSGLTLTSAGVLGGTPTSAGTYTFTVDATNSAGSDSTSALTITISVDGTPADSIVEAGPAPWLQSHGRPSHEDCPPGWHPSWAEWAVPSTGGWVCNRTIFWHGSAWMQSPDAVWGTTNPAAIRLWDGS